MRDDYNRLLTEERSQNSLGIDKMSTLELARVINGEDGTALDRRHDKARAGPEQPDGEHPPVE